MTDMRGQQQAPRVERPPRPAAPPQSPGHPIYVAGLRPSVAQETVTVHAVRVDKDGWRCIQFEPDGTWWIPEIGAGYPDLADLEDDRGATRPVRIVTTDPDDGELRRLANARLGWPACSGCGTALTRDDTSAECNRCVTTDPGAVDKMTGAPWTVVRDKDGQGYARYDDSPTKLSADRIAYLEGRLADERAAHAKTQQLAGVWPGMSAQEIRARALDAAVNMLADGEEGEFGDPSEVSVRWVLATADRFAGWIRDGSVPGEPT